MKFEFPVRYWEENIVFTQTGATWAYYKFHGFVYDYLSDEEKMRLFRKLESLFTSIGVETHLLILPKFQSVYEIHERSKKKVSGPLKHAALKHIDDTRKVIEERTGEQSSVYQFYMGLKLPEKNRSFSDWKTFIRMDFSDMFKRLFENIGTDSPDIPAEKIKHARKQANYFLRQLSDRFTVNPVDHDDMQWLIVRNFHRGKGKPPHRKGFAPQYQLIEDENGETIKRPFHADVLRLTDAHIDNSKGNRLIIGKDNPCHVAMLPIEFPIEIESAGYEWVYALQTLDFPVDMSIRTESIEYLKVKRILNRKKAGIKDQEQHAIMSNNDASLNTIENSELALDLEQSLNHEKHPLVKVSVVVSVYATDEDEMKHRIRIITDLYDDMNMMTQQPSGDQFLLFNEFIPGGERYVHDYLQYMEPSMLAAGMFGATKQIGDGEGFFAGTHGALNQPVYINPSLATQNVAGSKTRNPSSIFIGPPGGGKSFNANLITYLSVLSGARALLIDPKGERGDWDKDLVEMQGHVNIITLTSDDENKGRLDPFNICPTRERAKALALNIISFLLHIKTDDNELHRIYKAVDRVSETEHPSMGGVVDFLMDSEDDKDREIGERIAPFQDISFAKILFGDGSTQKAISIDNALNVLQVQNLQIPTADTDPDDYTLDEQLSMAMMLAIGEFSHEFIHSDNKIFKIVFFDEAWFMLKTKIGQKIIDRLIREGRYMKAGIYLATQNVNDVPDTVQDMIGSKYVFQSNSEKDIRNVLEFMGLSNDIYNIETVQNLRPEAGECLYQDIYGRTAVIRFDCLFDDLFKAFDTRPPEEEIEEERELVEI